MRSPHSRRDDLAFEDSLNDDWSQDLSAAEVPIGNRPLLYLGLAAAAIVLIVLGRIIYLNAAGGAYYRARAADNESAYAETPAPRGPIYDAEGGVLAESKASFEAVLDVRALLAATSSLASDTAEVAATVLGIQPNDLVSRIAAAGAANFATPIVLDENLTPDEIVNLQAADLPTIKVENDFVREYPQGSLFSSVVGYTGRPSAADLTADPTLTANDIVGKAGIEAFYDTALRGTPGVQVQYENASGKVIGGTEPSPPVAGGALHLTIDGGFQAYLASRLQGGLASLGRTVGMGLAMDPRTGAILSLVTLPSYDNNLFAQPGTSTNAAIQRILASPDQPLFNRIVNGTYNPGSTIKPLDGVAALADGVIDPSRTIFSPGYLLVPNPYNSSTPTRFLDWRPQGNVNLASALAQSSDVYFYIVSGGSPPASDPLLNDESDYGIRGIGINRLDQWWQAFGLGKPTGVDMPGEAPGFLPTSQWKQSQTGVPWLLGDTYNVAIGQGNLLLTPMQLLDYISAVANGGDVYRPFLNASSAPQVAEDLTQYLPEIRAVQQGMREGVASPLGTAYSLNDLGFPVCAKTGSAQIKLNTEENALFVGYAPCDHPQVALLLLVENAKQGSLNAVPIAKDVMNWYYWNRIASPAAGTAAPQATSTP